MRVGWTDRFGDEGGGADHLGMRVAGEAAYTQLIDFTTTQTWRPRYLSFYCWLLRQAFRAAGGDENRSENELDHAVWQETLKKGDYAYVAASLLVDPTAKRIAGSDKIGKRIAKGEIAILTDHLRSKRGGFDAYAGPMRQMGLVERASLRGGLLFDRPYGRGRVLAEAFEDSLSGVDQDQLLDKGATDGEKLRELGERCGLTVMLEPVGSSSAVGAELSKLRSCIVDWEGANNSEGLRRRILSIGLILRLFKLHESSRPGLLEFREFTLLASYRHDEGRRSHQLAEAYAPVVPSWALYEAHAFATYALECLLFGVLEVSETLEISSPDGVPINLALKKMAECVGSGSSFQGIFVSDDWYQRPLSELLATLRDVVSAGSGATTTETEIFERIQGSKDILIWAGDALLLFLISVERLRALLKLHGESAWPGSTDEGRLPPATLISRVDALDLSGPVGEIVPEILLQLVARQHRRTALRKLAANFTPDTALFQLEGRLLVDLVDLTRFAPGTSNPRFGNAVQYLEDLGYLHRDDAPGLTQEGEALLARIEKGVP